MQPRWLSSEEDAPALTPPTPAWVVAATIAGITTYIAFMFFGVVYRSEYVLGALPVVLPIVLITALIAKKLADIDQDPWAFSLIMGALSVKLIGSLLRYWVAYTVYDGQVDATDYDKVGRFIAASFRTGDFSVDLPGRFSGTNFLRMATGAVYTISPASRMSGFIIFAWFGFLGLILYWRAFKTAVPVGDHKRYALLIFLLPSLVYWPSAIGKEAWMMLALGFCALGIARIFTGRLVSGVLLLALGLVMSAYVRPHLGLAVFAGVLIGVLFRRRKSRNPIIPLVAMGLLLYVGLALVAQNQAYFGVENLTQESIDNTLEDTERRTADGGSSFTPVRVTNPAQFPLAFATIFYRPMPFEVSNLQGALTAAEGMIIIVLTLVSIRRVAAMPLYIRRYPYVAYAVGFIVLFVIAFSAFANFGILARQRTQVLPLYLVLLALPVRGRPRKKKPGEEPRPITYAAPPSAP
jgi:hypothetical protein